LRYTRACAADADAATTASFWAVLFLQVFSPLVLCPLFFFFVDPNLAFFFAVDAEREDREFSEKVNRRVMNDTNPM